MSKDQGGMPKEDDSMANERMTRINEHYQVDEYGIIRADDPTDNFDCLSLKELLNCMRRSSWDWPSAMFAIGGLDHEDEPTMYPGARELAWLKEVAPEEDWSDFDTMWDT